MAYRISALVILLLATGGWADEIQTKDGKKIEFKGLTDEGDFWEITTPQGTKVTVKKADFDRLIPGGLVEPPLTGAAFTFDKKRKLETVDLFSKVDVKKNVVSGGFTFAGGKLTGTGDGVNASRLVIPHTPPEEYDLTMVLERVKDAGQIGIGLIGGGNQFVYIFDAHNGTVSGAHMIDNKVLLESNLAIAGHFLDMKKPRTVTLMVRREAFIVQADGKDFFAWKADWKRVSLHPVFAIPAKNHLFLELEGGGVQVTRMVLTAPKEKP
jgi:hypothetical protein